MNSYEEKKSGMAAKGWEPPAAKKSTMGSRAKHKINRWAAGMKKDSTQEREYTMQFKNKKK